ncbi:DUF1643 domain-containing protein [Stutzerimonas xanthomarina]|uniref:DUF1643 domain-containing protein n=1 Tax=Stutzerimonas xanthomarina TaxID=271420 RepID=UPI003C6EE88B
MCRTFRYALWRTWDGSKKKVMFIGLNPATADETEGDRTIARWAVAGAECNTVIELKQAHHAA